MEDCLEALDRFGNKLTQLYGQGESPMTITALNAQMHSENRSSAVARPAGLGRYCSKAPSKCELRTTRIASCPLEKWEKCWFEGIA